MNLELFIQPNTDLLYVSYCHATMYLRIIQQCGFNIKYNIENENCSLYNIRSKYI